MSPTTIIIIGLLFFSLTCSAIIDAALKNFGGMEKKAIWILIASIPFIGWIIYFAVGYRKGTKNSLNK